MVSKFLLIVHDESVADTMNSWLKHHGSDATEQKSTGLGNGRTLLIVSADVDRRIRGRTFFAGVAVSPLAATIAYGAEGWKRAGRATDGPLTSGSFVAADWTRTEVRVRHDVFGTIPILQAHGPGFIALSDSLATLTDLRSWFGLINTPNAEVLLARSGLTPRHMQGLSSDTMVREITALPPGRSAVIRVASPMVLDVIGDDFSTLIASAAIEERDAYRAAAGFAAGSVAAIVESAGNSFVRSGAGIDSMALLAAASAGGVLQQIAIESDPTSDEYGAVQTLASELGFHVSAQVAAAGPSGTAGWAATGLGLYDHVLPLGSPNPPAERAQVDGLGGKLFRTVWGGTDANGLALASRLKGAAGSAYESQVHQGFRALGLESDRPNSSELFYAAYRHGIHSSSVPALGIPIRPLQQFALVAALHVRPLNRENPASGFEPIDILTALMDPRLIQLRASTPRESVRALSEAAAYGGGVSRAEVSSVTIHGELADAHVPPTKLSSSVVAGLGLDLQLGEDIAARADAALDGIDQPEVRDAYQPVLENSRWYLVDRGLPPARSGPSVGKLLALSIFTS